MDQHALTAEKRRRKRLNSQLLILVLGANCLGALLVVVFFLLGELVQDGLGTSASVSNNGMFIGVLIAVGSYIGGLLTKPLDLWYEKPEAAVPPPPRIQRLALNYPLLLAIVSFTMWFLAGIVNATFALQQGIGAALIGFIGMGGVAGPMTALLIYFAAERLWMPEIPIFFPVGQPGDVRAFRLSMRRRLFIPSLVGLVLILVMTLNVVALAQSYTALTPEMRAVQLAITVYRQLFLLGSAILAAILLTLTLGRTMSGAVETLQQQMAAVQAGQLEVRLPVASNDEFGALATGFNAMVQGLQQEEVVRRLFSLYVTPEVAAHAITHGAALGGQVAEATVLFADIRGFTTMTERLGPEAVIALLNRYFEAMSAAIIAQGGMVNKFGGDSLLAVFGTPVNPAEDHATRAIAAARSMLTALETFNADQQSRGEPELRIGIGIATGPVVAGNVGSAERLEYTVIGDTVNLASRLQELTKTLGSEALLAESTARAAGLAALKPLAQVEVRGKAGIAAVYTLGAEERRYGSA